MSTMTTPILISLTLSLATMACTRKDQAAPTPRTHKQPAHEQEPTSVTVGAESASLPIVLDEAVIRSYADTRNMSYQFEYLTTRRADALNFTDGKAELKFVGLTSGQKGDLKLDLLEGNVVKFTGVIKDLTLQAGPNRMPLVLKPVTTTTPDTGGSSGTGGSNGTGGSSGSGSDGSSTGGGTGGGTGDSGTGGGDTGGGDTGGSTTPPDPTQAGFTRDVKPIMEQHCAECHHQGKSLNLTRFPFTSGDQAQLVDRIISVISGGTMPPQPRDKLAASDIDALKQWKDAGLKP